jgi:hypothetical protein
MNLNFSKARNTPSTVEMDVALNGLGIHPDQALVALMLTHNGAAASANVFRISSNNSSGINRLIAVEDISYEMSLIDPIVAQRFFPFAHAEGGNYLCMSKDSADPSVYFLDHEFEGTEALTKVGDSLNAFLGSLAPPDATAPEKVPRVKSVWVDPEFMKELRNKAKP